MKHENTGDTALKERIFQKIDVNPSQAISFAEFMDLALYEPELGYYSQPGRAIGREGGDFYTSVSVGECFGLLLGYAIEAEWKKAGQTRKWLVVEQGAHDGQLALDILEGLKQRDSPLLSSLSYVVIEPHPGRRAFLARLLGEAGLISIVSSVDDIQNTAEYPAAGIFLCNELVDAFPVHLVRWKNEQWKELWVKRADTESGFDYQSRKIAGSDLLDEVARIDTEGFSQGYTTEINLEMYTWLKSITGIFGKQKGIWWLIDYGHREEDYYSPERGQGTLRCYREHRASDEPFEGLGESDITAHVNFTRLAEFAAQAGLFSEALQDQHDFLIHAARPWLLSMETDETTQNPENKKLLRQFQTLTHPGMMGRAFKVLRLSSP